jgi:hypothetical protein
LRCTGAAKSQGFLGSHSKGHAPTHGQVNRRTLQTGLSAYVLPLGWARRWAGILRRIMTDCLCAPCAGGVTVVSSLCARRWKHLLTERRKGLIQPPAKAKAKAKGAPAVATAAGPSTIVVQLHVMPGGGCRETPVVSQRCQLSAL